MHPRRDVPLLLGILLSSLACRSAAEDAGSRKRRLDLDRFAWTEQTSGTDASLRGVCAVDEHVAWASGANGTVLRTTDGGRRWKRCRVSGLGTLDFRDVHALDAQRAWILSAGRPAVIASTENGGETWIVQYRNDTDGVFFDALDFWDEKRGVAFSDPVGGAFLIVVTRNGGRSWREVPAKTLPKPLEGEAGFAGSGTCLRAFGESAVCIGTGGGGARVLQSLDGARSWTVARTPLRHGVSAGVFSIAFCDDQHGAAVGGDYKLEEDGERSAAWTRDGGRTWTPVDDEDRGLTGFRSAVEHVAGTDTGMIAVGPSGTDVSIDGGRSWRRVSERGFHAVSSAAGACWAVGADGRIARLATASLRPPAPGR